MSEQADLAGRVAVVTGATGGIGQAIATGLACAGADVVLTARDRAKLISVAAAIQDQTARPAVALAADVTSLAAVTDLKCEVESRLGTATILVNAAGSFGPLAPVSQSDPERWIDTVLVNALGPFLTCRMFVPEMLRIGWGRVVNVSSAATLRPPGALGSAYASSKAALNQMTRHLAAELNGSGVTANVIHPGSIVTAMTDEIRREVVQLGEEGKSFRDWLEHMETTGGDSTANAVALVLDLVNPQSRPVNGSFCWTPGTLEAPLESW